MKRLTKLENCIGKTIKNIKILEKDDDYVLYEMLRIEFDDDTFIEEKSWHMTLKDTQVKSRLSKNNFLEVLILEFAVLRWQLEKQCKKCKNFIKVKRIEKQIDEDYGQTEDIIIEVKRDCIEVCPYIKRFKLLTAAELLETIKP